MTQASRPAGVGARDPHPAPCPPSTHLSSVIQQTVKGSRIVEAAVLTALPVVWQLPIDVGNTVAQVPPKSTYAEPTVMWRLCNPDDNRRAYAMIVPHGSKATAGWFSQGIPQESRDFATWHDAISWLEVKLRMLQRRGWRLDDPAE